MLAWTVFAYLFGRWQFESNLRFDSRQNRQPCFRRGPRREVMEHQTVPPPFGAVSRPGWSHGGKRAPQSIRTPRFRLVFVMGFTFAWWSGFR